MILSLELSIKIQNLSNHWITPVVTLSIKINCSSKTKKSLQNSRVISQICRWVLEKQLKDNDMNADNLMIVFKFITERDSFEEHYRRLLAKRLINGTSNRKN